MYSVQYTKSTNPCTVHTSIICILVFLYYSRNSGIIPRLRFLSGENIANSTEIHSVFGNSNVQANGIQIIVFDNMQCWASEMGMKTDMIVDEV